MMSDSRGKDYDSDTAETHKFMSGKSQDRSGSSANGDKNGSGEKEGLLAAQDANMEVKTAQEPLSKRFDIDVVRCCCCS